MKKILFILLFTIPFIGFGQSTTEINKFLSETSSTLNQNTPMVIDEYTTLINTFGGIGMFIYNYQVDKNVFLDYGISESSWLVLQTEILKNTFCTDPSFDIFRSFDIDLVWRYSDMYGVFIAKITLNGKDCK